MTDLGDAWVVVEGMVIEFLFSFSSTMYSVVWRYHCSPQIKAARAVVFSPLHVLKKTNLSILCIIDVNVL